MKENNIPELIKAVEGWLKTQGFPLEMAVARIFSEYGFAIRQGWYFSDPEEGKPREIDLLIFEQINTVNPILFQFIIECKYSAQPFIVFTISRRDLYGLIPEYIPGNSTGKTYINKIVSLGLHKKLPLFKPLSALGYTLKQAYLSESRKQDTSISYAKSGSKDDAFDALMKVSKATDSLVSIYKKKEHPSISDRDIPQIPLGYIALPLIVLEGNLFECYLDNNNAVNINQIYKTIINWNSPRTGSMPILVVTKPALDQFVSDARETFWNLNEANINLR